MNGQFCRLTEKNYFEVCEIERTIPTINWEKLFWSVRNWTDNSHD